MFTGIYFEGGGGGCGTIGVTMYLFLGAGILVGRDCCWMVILGSGCVEIY